MVYISKHIRIFVRILLAAIILNSSMSYAACCIDMDAAASETEVSCHESDDNKNTDENNCCASCLIISLPAEQAQSTSDLAQENIPTNLASAIIRNIHPLFRPPIIHHT